MRTIFNAGWQLRKVWFVAPLSLLCGGVLVWLGGYVFQSYGLEPVDGGVLKPLATRVLLGGAFAAGGIAIIAGILLYLRCYVARIEADDAGGGFRVTLAGPGRTLPVNPVDVVRAQYNDGVYHARGLSVNAPWYTLRLRGRRLPLIVDMQGEFLDECAVGRLIEGEPVPAIGPAPARKPRHRRRRR